MDALVCASDRGLRAAPARQPATSSSAIRLLLPGEIIQAELHWYEAHGTGKVELKIKELL